MKSKERVLNAIKHKKVDRVPIGAFGTDEEYEKGLMNYVNASSIEEMYTITGIDIWHCHTYPGLEYVGEQRYYQGKEADFWGIPFDSFEEKGYSSQGNPFSDISSVKEVERYQWPDVDDFTGDKLAREIETHADNFAIVGGINAPIFHNFTWLCGFEEALVKLKLQPEVSKTIIHYITDFWIDYLKKVLELGQGKIDIIENCNDFGTQRAMFINVETFREFFKPELKRFYNVARSYGMKIMQHSCGSVAPIISDFIEIGADIINPIQVAADNMNIEELAKKYKNQVCFYGGIDTQQLLPQGPEEKIKEVTRQTIDLFGNNGGYILSGSQGLMNDIPYEHALAMFEEGKKEFNIG